MGSREPFNLAGIRRIVHVGALRAAGATLVGIALVAGARGPSTPPDDAGRDGCAVWVVRNALTTEAAWGRALEAVERIGCGTMYLQVSGRWDAYFDSDVFPAPAARPGGAGWADDPFGRAVREARARGIEVHAWINAMIAWSAEDLPPDPAHAYRARPDWFVKDARGRSMRSLSRSELDRAGLVGEGWFLDPGREEVRTELRRFVLEVATRYPIDGVHLDYIRYPAGWSPPDGHENVTRLVSLIRSDLGTVRPEAALSAAVMPRPDVARSSFGQDWAEWLRRGIVDEVAPMVYRDSPGAVLATVEGWPSDLPLGKVRVGVRIDRLSPGETREAARRLREAGALGVALFSHNLLLDRSDWRRAGGIAGAGGENEEGAAVGDPSSYSRSSYSRRAVLANEPAR